METSTSFDAAWSRFQELTSPVVGSDHVTLGRAQFLAFVVPVRDRAAKEHLASVAGRVAGIPGVEPYPDWYWHITLKGVGFQVIAKAHDDDVLRKDVPRIAGKARAILRQEETFGVQLGHPNGFPDAVVVEVCDGGQLVRLHGRLLDGIEEAHRYPVDGPSFLPHVSIARFTSDGGFARLQGVLGELRSAPMGPSFTVDTVELVRAWFTEETPEFDTIATYRLGSAR